MHNHGTSSEVAIPRMSSQSAITGTGFLCVASRQIKMILFARFALRRSIAKTEQRKRGITYMKCIPTTFCGLEVTDAIRVIDIELVLEAIIALGPVICRQKTS